MQAQQSQPVHVADLPATELGGSGINSTGGHYIFPVTNAAAVLPSPTLRYPLAPPAVITNCKRPWGMMTTSKSNENERVQFPSLQDRKRPWDKPTTITMHEELQSTPKFPVVAVGPAVVAASPPRQIEASNVLDMRPCKSKRTRGILLLCGGPNNREVYIYIYIQSVDLGGF